MEITVSVHLKIIINLPFNIPRLSE
jgi:hypothetical protein